MIHKAYKLIGTVSDSSFMPLMNKTPWLPLYFDLPPLPVLSPPPTYALTMGSGCAANATTSIHGLTYQAAFDVVRYEWNPVPGEPPLNSDHYVTVMNYPSNYSVYKAPPTPYHWITTNSPFLDVIPRGWSIHFKSVLEKRRTNKT